MLHLLTFVAIFWCACASSSDSSEFEEFTLENFNAFKDDVLYLLNCNVSLGGSNPCPGINNVHPDTSVYDLLGGDADANVATQLVRFV